MNPRALCIASVVLAAAGTASAQFQTRVDTLGAGATVNDVISPGEYGPGNSYSFSANGNTGFGGPVGLSSLYMSSDASNIYIGFQRGQPTMNGNNFVLYLDTRAGGFTDAMMNDTSDGGRTSTTNPMRDGNVVFPVLPDFAIVFGDFGTVVFELTGGSLNFVAPFFPNGGSTQPEVVLDRAFLGNPGQVDFFGLFTSNDGYLSNEALPIALAYGGPTDGGGNPGYGAGETASLSLFSRFVPIPAPGAASLLGIAGLMAARRRR